MEFEMEQKIKHKIFGEGEVVYIDGKYIDVHFDNESKHVVRTFSIESIADYLVD